MACNNIVLTRGNHNQTYHHDWIHSWIFSTFARRYVGGSLHTKTSQNLAMMASSSLISNDVVAHRKKLSMILRYIATMHHSNDASLGISFVHDKLVPWNPRRQTTLLPMYSEERRMYSLALTTFVMSWPLMRMGRSLRILRFRFIAPRRLPPTILPTIIRSVPFAPPFQAASWLANPPKRVGFALHDCKPKQPQRRLLPFENTCAPGPNHHHHHCNRKTFRTCSNTTSKRLLLSPRAFIRSRLRNFFVNTRNLQNVPT